MALSEHFELRPHRHSGKFLAHHHTSYAGLAIVMLIAGLALLAVSFSAQAVVLTGSGTISIGGIVPGPPPATAPTIETPLDNQHFKSIPVDVSGACIADLIVVIWRGSDPAGSVVCAANGRYQLQIDLVFGQNLLTARQYDALNQASPASPTVTVFYDQAVAPKPPVVGNKPASGIPVTSPPVITPTPPQLLINIDYRPKSAFPGSDTTLPITLVGGIKPYAISVDWGDGHIELLSQDEAGEFRAHHSYDKPGTYTVKIKAADKSGQSAFAQGIILVSGPVVVPTGTTTPGNGMLIAWPVFGVMTLMLVSFWLGELFDRRRWDHRQRPAS